ncbi:MAG: HAMP domain-containing protein, partial [Deltaproteobacteria bacterium]
MLVTTRDAPEAAAGTLTAGAVGELVRGGSIAFDREPVGAGVWRVSTPLRRDEALVGAAQVELSLDELAHLKRRLRLIDAAILVCSTLLISVALAFFLERRVGRPVAVLVAGMQRAESGELGVRVAAARGGEFAFVAGTFNR